MADPFDLDDFDSSGESGESSRPPGMPTAGLSARLFGDEAARAAGAEASPPAAPAYLEGLNERQREAVLATEGPVLVLAGAGTGKTRVLTTRLAHILASRKAWPGQILAVTFTNKAAREMKERIRALIGDMVEGMAWLGTFHAIGVRLLQRHAGLAGLKSGFAILDTDDQVRLIKQVMAAENIDEKRFPARQMAALIDGWKNRGLMPDAVPAGEAAAFAAGRGAQVYARYQERLRALNAVDFGDLLLLPVELLKTSPELLSEYRRRFRYILVDEYQDTNTAQYLLLRLLAGENGNICCVGDDDQSIYGWRGAVVENILRFPRDFPQAKVIRLELNYRSTGHILAAANGLIAHNRGRLGKELRSAAGMGEKVRLRGHMDDAEEARAISDDIEGLLRAGHPAHEIAILVRASFQMRRFEERFVEIGLPYHVVGGPRFYERQEVRDALAYLRVIHAPDHDLAFERIINVPRRGIGATSLKKLHQLARLRGISLYRAAELMADSDELPARTRRPLKDLMTAFSRWRAQAGELSPAELAGVVLEESGYVDMWKAEKDPRAEGRLENLRELVRSMEEFDTLGGFLEHVALVMEADQAAGHDKVVLMTMHAAKGLEFDTVFLPGWEEGVFPNQRALDEAGEAALEEERRLAYVALTRARRRAVISCARMRRVHNMWQPGQPSRFIDELPPGHVEIDEGPLSLSPAERAPRPASPAGSAEGPATAAARPVVSRRGGHVPRDAGSGAKDAFREGQRVFHQKFGYGTIAAVDGERLTIDFEKTGRKRIMAAFVTAA
jgi:DNA helicase-2/ATP-dependent DNA helicase PcrA